MTKIVKMVVVSLMVLTSVTAIVCFAVVPNANGDAVSAAVLKQGSTGAQVKTVQTKLKNWGYYSGGIDGIYGSKTTAAVKYFQSKNGLTADGIVGAKTAAVKYFQSKNGLTADGIVGAKTAAAMGISLTSSTTSSNSGYSSSDVYLLAKCVYAEARGEPYLGQVAIAAVVLNRVKSSSFPNSISGVIYQPYAFTAVADGQINLTPNDTAKKAAQDALNGWDPTNGCIYYYNPSTATSAWIWTRTVKLTIGRHNFAV